MADNDREALAEATTGDERRRRYSNDFAWETPTTHSYWSVTGQYVVTWTRDDQGVWHTDDGRDETATDEDIRQAKEAAHDHRG